MEQIAKAETGTNNRAFLLFQDIQGIRVLDLPESGECTEFSGQKIPSDREMLL